MLCTWTIKYTPDSEMHRAPFVPLKVRMEKLNHPSHLNDAHYLVVVFFSRQLVISLPVFRAWVGEEKEDRKESPGWGEKLLLHVCKLYGFPEISLNLW